MMNINKRDAVIQDLLTILKKKCQYLNIYFKSKVLSV